MEPADEEKPQETLDDQMERFSETSSIELVIQGGGSNEQSNSSVPILGVAEKHNYAFNPYPGIKKQDHVPVDIVKSFTPVAHSEQPKNEDGAEIYNDYVQDPYNLTLQMNNNLIGSQVPSNPTSTFFQSSSYFNDTTDLNASSTAPGSELFNRP